MLTDALDGTLSAADQAIFDTHMAHCGPCSQMLADARRGAAWLEMLRDPRPEPPAELLERILAQTSGIPLSAQVSPARLTHAGIAATQLPGAVLAAGSPASIPAMGKVLPFRSRLQSAFRAGSFMLQPRLAMTAAMAFFSVALTLDLTGVSLRNLKVSDLKPGSLKRDFYSANAKVVQYYEGLRVVYELESRVHDLQSSSDGDTPAGTQTGPQGSPAQSPDKPGGQDKAKPGDVPQPESKPPANRQAPRNGSSRREELMESRRLVGFRDEQIFGNSIHAREKRALA